MPIYGEDERVVELGVNLALILGGADPAVLGEVFLFGESALVGWFLLEEALNRR